MRTKMNRISGSFRDPDGFVFENQGRIFRFLTGQGITSYEMLMNSGLYKKLREKNRILTFEKSSEIFNSSFMENIRSSSEEFSDAPQYSNANYPRNDAEYSMNIKEKKNPSIQTHRAFEILETEKLDFVSYPYEWSFSQLKDAALLTLAVQQDAMKFDMSLKDAVGFNVQFHRGRPVFIDLPSLEPLREGEPWHPYRQFISHFIGPLLLISRVDWRFNLDLTHFIDGLPLDYISRLLPMSTWLSPSCLIHIHWHARMIARYEKTKNPVRTEKTKDFAQLEKTKDSAQSEKTKDFAQSEKTKDSDQSEKKSAVFTKRNLENLIDSLLSFVKGIAPPKMTTEWDDYYNDTNYDATAFAEKKKLVAKIIAELAPGTTIDLGANRGDFSRIAAEHSQLVLAPDRDPNAVECNYLTIRRQKEEKIFPFLLDLCSPTPAIGWRNSERQGIFERLHGDLVLALALIHHLCIGNNVPLQSVAEMFRQMAPSLLLEFVPKEDGQVQRLLRSRDDIFPNYSLNHCLTEFGKFYPHHRILPIPSSQRVLILFEN